MDSSTSTHPSTADDDIDATAVESNGFDRLDEQSCNQTVQNNLTVTEESIVSLSIRSVTTVIDSEQIRTEEVTAVASSGDDPDAKPSGTAPAGGTNDATDAEPGLPTGGLYTNSWLPGVLTDKDSLHYNIQGKNCLLSYILINHITITMKIKTTFVIKSDRRTRNLPSMH